ncbi:MAG TPA: SRPBCC domain-containing protein [Acidobacteriaceae bacterium]|nr:SRPBCC domain-containing protein [Acidobacteriaceae bacterium]
MAENTATLVIEREFAQPIEKVWRALTESDLIAQWLMGNNFAPTVGHAFEFRMQPVGGWDGVIHSKVLVVEPIKKLSYTWGSMGLELVVNFTLTSAAGGTHLKMEQTGFPDNTGANYNGAKYGWTGFLGKMDSVVAGL